MLSSPRHVISFFLFIFALFLIYMSFNSQNNNSSSSPDIEDISRRSRKLDSKTFRSYLSFNVSGGVIVQRLSLLHAAFFAYVLEIDAIVLPSLYDEEGGKERGVKNLFDQKKLKKELQERLGVEVVEKKEIPNEICKKYVLGDLWMTRKTTAALRARYLKFVQDGDEKFPVVLATENLFASVVPQEEFLNPHIEETNAITNKQDGVDTGEFKKIWKNMWRLYDFVEFNNDIKALANVIKEYLFEFSPTYNALHIKAPKKLTEEEAKLFGAGILNQLQLMKCPSKNTLFLTCTGCGSAIEHVIVPLSRKYHVVVQDRVFKIDQTSKGPHYQAAIDYLVCLESLIFIGTRASVFSVSAKEERLRKGLVSYFHSFDNIRTAAEVVVGHDYVYESEDIVFDSKETLPHIELPKVVADTC